MEVNWLKPGSISIAKLLHRENLALAILVSAALVSFFAISASARLMRDQRHRDAAFFYEEGHARAGQGHTEASLEAFGRAKALRRDHLDYQLAFARALLDAGRVDAARQAFVAMQADHPESPDAHLGLAEIDERRGDVEATIRLRQRALYASWPADRFAERERVRESLIDYLLDRDMRARALPELLTLSADLPADAAAHVHAGELFLRAGEPRRAAAHFTRALELAPAREDARAGAARAAFALEQYDRVESLLRPLGRVPEDLESIRDDANAVVRLDPLRRGLSAAERARRMNAGLRFAERALLACPAAVAAPGAAEALSSLKSRRTAAEAAQALDDIGATLALVSSHCGAGDVEARAWMLIAKLHGWQP